jgi:hypothetical protein
LLLSAALSPAAAQVRIGSTGKAASSALVDIRTQAPDADNQTTLVGGMLLPCVKLADTPILTSADNLHVGMVVYNLSETANYVKGPYIWDGKQWIQVGNNTWLESGNHLNSHSTPSDTWVGTSDNQDFVLRTNNTERLRLGAKGVGLGTKDPQRALDVAGGAHFTKGLKTPGLRTVASTSIYNVLVDPKGRIERIDTKEKENVLNYLQYKLYTGSDGSISACDTQLDTTKYTLVVVGSQLKLNYNALRIASKPKVGSYTPMEVLARPSKSTGTWVITARYVGSVPIIPVSGSDYWLVNCVILNNLIGEDLGTFDYRTSIPADSYGDMVAPNSPL